MKKLILILTLMLFLPVHAFAAWTVTTTLGEEHGGYFWATVECTSDGSALSATSILESASSGFYTKGRSIKMLHGAQARIMFVSPGTGGVAPGATIDITLTNENDSELWADTGISYTTDTSHQLWADTGDLLPIVGDLLVAVNDIGDSGDQVTLYILCVLGE